MRSQSGFTLIEFIIVIILISIVAKVSSQMIAAGFQTFLTSSNVTNADWQGRLATGRMARDIREVRSSNDITTASSTQFTFNDNTGTSITYNLSGSSLMRNTNVLADGISTITFNYYDLNGNATSTTTAIRFIKITLGITQGNTNFTLITAINPRNLL